MALYKRGGTYTSMVWVDGVRYIRALHTGNKRLADTLDRQHKEELIERQYQMPQFNPSMTFGELYARFVAEGNAKEYHRDRAKYVLDFFSKLEVGRITRNDVLRFRKLRQAEYAKLRPGRVLTDATANRDVGVLRRILFWAVDEGILQANPLARVPMVRERRRRRPVMSVADEQKLLAEAAPHLARIIRFALFTGMRRGEIFHQLWEDIDFDRNVLSVTHSKTPEGEHREIPLSSQVVALLGPERQDSGLVFTYKGEQLHRIKTAWKATIRRAGIPYLRFHDLRHTFNSRLVEVGVIADVRKELMGHSRGGDVHSIYTHVELPLLRTAIDKLDVWYEAQLKALPTTVSEGGESDVQSRAA